MSKHNIIRAWKDPAYRSTLTAAERESIPQHPAGGIEMPQEALETIAAGRLIQRPSTMFACTFDRSCPDTQMCTYFCP